LKYDKKTSGYETGLSMIVFGVILYRSFGNQQIF